MDAAITLTIANDGNLVIFEAFGPVTVHIIPALQPDEHAEKDSAIGFTPPIPSEDSDIAG
jgi:hypothetical protein